MRTISLILMFTLAIGPALASACTVACALPMDHAEHAHHMHGMAMDPEIHAENAHAQTQSKDMQSTANIGSKVEGMGSEMDMHCYQGAEAATPDKDGQLGKHVGSGSNSNTSHQSANGCSMTDCHLAQVPPLASPDHQLRIDAATLLVGLPNQFGASADLHPPIKPPA